MIKSKELQNKFKKVGLFQQQERGHKKGAKKNQDDLQQGRGSVGMVAVELGNQIGSSQINKTAGGDGQHILGKILDVGADNKSENNSHQGKRSTNQIETESLGQRPALVKINGKIPHFLGYFMDQNRESGGNANGQRHQKTAGNDNTVDQIVDNFTGQTDRDNMVGGIMTFRIVTVAPADNFFN